MVVLLCTEVLGAEAPVRCASAVLATGASDKTGNMEVVVAVEVLVSDRVIVEVMIGVEAVASAVALRVSVDVAASPPSHEDKKHC